MENYFNTRGSLLLVTLLAIGAAMIGVGVMSTVIIRELGLSKDLDNSALAIYGAEGALEQALYNSVVLGQTTAQINNTNGVYGNGVAWKITASDTTPALTLDRLQTNGPYSLNIYNKNDPSIVAAGVESLKLVSSFGHDFEITISDWDGVTLTNTRIIALNNCANPCLFNDPAATKSYQLSLKALNNDALDLVITAWSADSGGGAQVPLSIPTTLTGVANVGNSRQAVSATLRDSAPWQ